MNAFNPIEFTHRLEAQGFKRGQAEVLADGYRQAMEAHVTHEQLKAALDRQSLYIVGLLGSLVVGCTAILGVLLS